MRAVGIAQLDVCSGYFGFSSINNSIYSQASLKMSGFLVRFFPKLSQAENIHLMYGPEGNSLFCFPESPDNIRTRGKTKLTSFLSDHTCTLSVLYYYDYQLSKARLSLVARF